MDVVGYARETGNATHLPRLRAGWRRLQRGILQLWHYVRYRRSYFFHLVLRKWRMGLLREFLGEIYY
jgi:hypothetical protein